MPRKTSTYSETEKLKQLFAQGWCAFEELYGNLERNRLADSLKTLVDGLDPSRLTGFGATIFSLASRQPQMRRELQGSTILPFIARALEDVPHLRRTGARISGPKSCERIAWHHHEGWGVRALAGRRTFQRLLFIVYLHGSDMEHGPLVVRPRGFDEPLQNPPADLCHQLRGEQHLEYPPGTVIVMDTPVLHSALRGTGSELRMVFGAHCQARRIDRAHPEDDPHFEKMRVGLRFQGLLRGLWKGRPRTGEPNRQKTSSGDRR